MDISFQPREMHLWKSNKEVDDINLHDINIALNQIRYVSEAVDYLQMWLTLNIQRSYLGKNQ